MVVDAPYVDVVDIAFVIDDFASFKTDVRVYTPVYSCGGFQWRLLIFPNGNRVENVLSVYLDFLGPDSTRRCCPLFAPPPPQDAVASASTAPPPAYSHSLLLDVPVPPNPPPSSTRHSHHASDHHPSGPTTPTTTSTSNNTNTNNRRASLPALEISTHRHQYHQYYHHHQCPFHNPSAHLGGKATASTARTPSSSSVVEAHVYFSVVPPPPTPPVCDGDSSGVISTTPGLTWLSEPAAASSSAFSNSSSSSKDDDPLNANGAQEPVQLKDCGHRFTEPDNDWGFRELISAARAKRYIDGAGRLSLRAKVHVFSQVYTHVRDKILQASASQTCNWLEVIPLVQQYGDLAANAPTRTGIADHNDGASLFHAACKAGNRAYAALLLARGANIYAEDIGNRSPLVYATRAGHIPLIEWLLDELHVNVNARDLDGRTPLFYACEDGRTAIAKILISRGAEVQTTDSVGETPVRVAEDRGYDELATILREMQRV